jgi:hypothetical protein
MSRSIQDLVDHILAVHALGDERLLRSELLRMQSEHGRKQMLDAVAGADALLDRPTLSIRGAKARARAQGRAAEDKQRSFARKADTA